MPILTLSPVAKQWWQNLNINEMDDLSFKYYNKPWEELSQSNIWKRRQLVITN